MDVYCASVTDMFRFNTRPLSDTVKTKRMYTDRPPVNPRLIQFRIVHVLSSQRVSVQGTLFPTLTISIADPPFPDPLGIRTLRPITYLFLLLSQRQNGHLHNIPPPYTPQPLTILIPLLDGNGN